MSFSNRLLKAMTAKGFSQNRLAKDSGVRQGTISRLLAGLRGNPEMETVKALAGPLGITVDYLVGRAGDGQFSVPIAGVVAAGVPVEACEVLHDTLDLADLFGNGVFMLRIRGDSMTGARIFDGDLVGIRPFVEPVAGTIVVAYIEGEATVKRLRKVRGQWELHAEPPGSFGPLSLAAVESSIQGVVVCTVREF